jgi:hypothetical protein
MQKRHRERGEQGQRADHEHRCAAHRHMRHPHCGALGAGAGPGAGELAA